MYDFQAGEGGFKGLLAHQAQHRPSPGLETWGLVIWGTVLHLSPLFNLLPPNGSFFF